MANDLNAKLMKNRFYELLDSHRRSRPSNCNVSISDQRYKQIIEDIETARSKSLNSQHELWLFKNYNILNVNGTNRLICPTNGSQKIFYLSDGELFDALHKVHTNIGHGRQARMGIALRKQYINVTKNVIDLYIELCKECQTKPTKPILTPKYTPRGETTLIDLQINPDGDYNFILVYQDHFTKFIILKPLKTDQLNEVAYNLFDIFTTFGPPAVLRYYNSLEYIKKILAYFKEHWPTLKMVYDIYKYTKDRAEMVNLIKDIKIKLLDWMQQQNNKHWSFGVPFIQLNMNKSYKVEILQSPFKTLFGRTIQLGVELKNSENLCTEEDLEDKLEPMYVNKPKREYIPPDLESVKNKILVPKLKTKIDSTSKKKVKKSSSSEPITDNYASTVNNSNSSIIEPITIHDPSSESIIIDSLPSSELLNNSFTITDAVIDVINSSDSKVDDLSTSEFIKNLLSAPVIETVTDSEPITEFDPNAYPVIIVPPASALETYMPNSSVSTIDLSEFNIESYDTLPQAESIFGDISNTESFNNITANTESTATIVSISESNIITPETIFESIISSESLFDSLPLTESIDDSLPILESTMEDFRIIFK